VQNNHAYLHEVAGVLQQILKAFLFDANGNLLHLDNIANLEWYYNNTLNKLTKADYLSDTQRSLLRP
jgi:hypothetical protein